MDAVAVSLARGLAMTTPRWRDALVLAGAFGGFQLVMPLLGWLLSTWFAHAVTAAAPWIAFALLALIGGLMIKEFFDGDDDADDDAARGGRLTAWAVLSLAVATSIDAFAVGVTFGVLKVSVVPAVSLIGVITFALSLVAVFVGTRASQRLGRWAELVGGIVLVGIGARIALAHLGVL